MLEFNKILQLEITKCVYGGRGMGKANGCVVFVEGAVPGDIVQVKIKKRKSNYAEAEITELIKPSERRIKPQCPIFGLCGGCTWQNLSYEEQLKFKDEIALTSLEHIGKSENLSTLPILPSPEIWRYRNKMDFTFGRDANSNFALGMHKKNSFHEIIDVEQCLICPESFEKVLRIVRNFCVKNSLPPYNPITHEGLLRHLIIREGRNTNELIITLLTYKEEFPKIESLAAELKHNIDNLVGFSWGINSKIADAPNIDKIVYQEGQDHFFEKLGDLKLQVSATSFLQTNTHGAEKLYSIIKDFLEIGDTDIIFDAYCGTGSIGLFAAEKNHQLYGIDIVLSSIWDARRNASINGINNSIFIAGDMHKTIPMMLQAVNSRITRIIVDPPRSGMDKKSLRYIIEINSPIIVYVSCNPTTLARDMTILSEAGYLPTKIQSVDMFPHTYHIESVIQFKKNN